MHTQSVRGQNTTIRTIFKKSEAKTFHLKTQLSAQRRDNKYNRRRIKELSASRDNWKEKNSSKGKRIKVLSRQLERQDKVCRHHYPLLVVQLCVMLRVFCGCSYRGASKVIKILGTYSILEISRCPSAATVQNWVTKMGFHQRQYADNELIGEERVLIIDESIRIGQEKQLLVLSTPFTKTGGDSLRAQDVVVHYFGGRTSWTGKHIGDVIEGVRNQTGMVCKALLSDEGAALKKAGRLQQLPHLPDICHAVGTCLKQTFEKQPVYGSLMTLLRRYRQKGVNRGLSYLLPPKQGSKARFLNVSESVKWAQGMLANFKKSSPTERAFFSELPDYQPMIATLKWCLQLAEQVSLPLKKQGIGLAVLEKVTAQITRAKQKAEADGNRPVALFLTKLATYIALYQAFIKEHEGTNIPVSSEIIESLFGVYKKFGQFQSIGRGNFLKL